MLIRIGYELAFEVPRPTAMQLMLYVHPDQAGALRHPEKIVVEPDLPVADFTDGFGNHAARILAPASMLRWSIASPRGARAVTLCGAYGGRAT